ncbi:MAG: fasciclin domain-containing protein [Vicinamibacterales bacterium]
MHRFICGVALAALTLVGTTSAASAQGMGSGEKTVMVGGAPMYPSKDIIENAMMSKDHTTLVAAVKAAGLVETLKGQGPFTVFAPTNAAFAALPTGTVDTLLKPENKAKLTSVLTYHVVPGRLDAAALMAQAEKMNGKAMLKTVNGQELTVIVKDGSVMLQDGQGNMARVTTADVYQSNGVIHVIDKVVMAK